MNQISQVLATDYPYLEQCLILAKVAYDAGDEPFGSVLVNEQGEVIFSSRNRAKEISPLAHPEYDIAQWAVQHLSIAERKSARVYTSGEHCPMCSAAHAWAGLGGIVYLSSAQQLSEWRALAGLHTSVINFHPIQDIIPGIELRGPGEGELLEEIKQLQISAAKRQLNNQS